MRPMTPPDTRIALRTLMRRAFGQWWTKRGVVVGHAWAPGQVRKLANANVPMLVADDFKRPRWKMAKPIQTWQEKDWGPAVARCIERGDRLDYIVFAESPWDGFFALAVTALRPIMSANTVYFVLDCPDSAKEAKLALGLRNSKLLRWHGQGRLASFQFYDKEY